MSNFRPISLLSIPGKILEDIITDSIDNHIEAQDLLSDNQWAFAKIILQKTRWVNDGRTDQWWQEPEEDWKTNFRITRLEFEDLCEQLGPHIFPDPKSPNRRALSVGKKVAFTLYYLTDTGSMWMTGNTFEIHQSTVSNIVLEVCDTITKHLGPEEMQRKVSQFELKIGMTQAFGCIDGTHVRIKTPSTDSHDYSLNVQVVCDYCGMFIDVDFQWPGCVHDAKVFANSTLNHTMRSESLSHEHDKVPN
ncbi:uncharacterized protein [Montipora capricornis]|uniref:uncharacterized protein n=1 Tax=Montipora capricornis TaxID=246305 RepID=UPI0035F11505